MNKLLLALGTILVAVLTALFVVPSLVDWNDFKGVLEEEASRALGRDVRVAGKVDLRILPMPYVQFERVSVADARGITGAPFMEARSFRLWLSVPPLLRGAIEARRVEVEGAELRLRIGEDGGGNWQTLRIDPSLASWMPAEVAFQSIQLSDSRVTVEGPGRSALASIEGITGELSAQALSGPFKFVGTIGKETGRRALRLTVSEIDRNGHARVRAQAGGVDGGTAIGTLSIDGTLESIATRPELKGTVTYTGSRGAAGEAAGHELKTGITANAFGATFDDLSIAFEQGGRPQLLTGRAVARWRDAAELDARLTSRWLDLDRISASDPARGPLAALDRLAQLVGSAGSSQTRIRLALAIDQATLAGDVASGIGVELILADGRRLIESARAALPGGTEAHASGELVAESGATGFNGRLYLSGSSRARFLAWVGKGEAPLLAASSRDGSFLFDGQLTTSPALVALTDARLGLDGVPVGVSMSLRRGVGHPFLHLAVSGRRLDLARVAPGSLAPERLVAWLSSRGMGTAGSGTTRLKVRLDEASDSEAVYRNVDIDLALENGALDVARLSADLSDDAHVDVAGRLTGLGGATAGTLSGVVAAASHSGRERLARFFASAFGHRLIPETTPGTGPLRLAFRAALSPPGQTGAVSRLEIDGSVGADAVRVELESRGPAVGWRGQPLAMTATLSAADLTRTIAELADQHRARRDHAGNTADPAMAGRFVIQAAGRPDRGLRTHVSLTRPGSSAVFDGLMSLAADDRLQLDGRLALDADRVGALVEAFYPRLAARLAEQPFSARLRLDRDAAGVRLAGEEIVLGGVRMAAQLDVTGAGDTDDAGGRLIAGRIEAARVSLPALVALVSSAPTAGAPVAGDVWLERPFALDAMPGVTHKLAIATQQLVLTDGLAAGKARFAVRLADGKAAIEKLEAAVLGGRLTGDVTLSAHAVGAAAKGRLALTNARLDGWGDGAVGRGGLSGDVVFEGVALSPRALATTLKGKGSFAVTEAVLKGVTTEAVASAATAVLAASGEPPAAADALAAALDTGNIALGDRTIALTIADGAARLAALALDGPGGRAVNRITFDLAAVAVESDWRLEPKALAADAGVLAGRALPPVQLTFIGRPGAIASLERRIAAEPLARELTVLKMERDVRELERIRREDEERASAERERQRLEQQARLKAADEARRLSQQPAVVPVPASGNPAPAAAPTAAPAGPAIVATPVAPSPAAVPAAPGGPAGSPIAPAPAPAAPGAGPAPVSPPPAPRRPPRRQWQPFDSSR